MLILYKSNSISMKFNLFSSCYSWKIVELVLNYNHSLTHNWSLLSYDLIKQQFTLNQLLIYTNNKISGYWMFCIYIYIYIDWSASDKNFVYSFFRWKCFNMVHWEHILQGFMKNNFYQKQKTAAYFSSIYPKAV